MQMAAAESVGEYARRTMARIRSFFSRRPGRKEYQTMVATTQPGIKQEATTIAPVPAGSPFPLGATPVDGGVNFSVYSDNAVAVDLLLFDHVDAAPTRVIHLDPASHRTNHYWHAAVPDLRPGQIYAY